MSEPDTTNRRWQAASDAECPECGQDATILYGSQWTCPCGAVNPVSQALVEWECVRNEARDGVVMEKWANRGNPGRTFTFTVSTLELAHARYPDPVAECRKVYMARHGIVGTMLDPPRYTKLQLSVPPINQTEGM